MKFDDVRKTIVTEERKTPAQRIMSVPTNVWAATWSRRPRDVVKIGLRLVSDGVMENAQTQASSYASGKAQIESEDWTAFHNDALIRCVLLDAMCDPDNITRLWDGWTDNQAHAHLAEDVIRFALTREGLRWFWREYVCLTVECGLIAPPVDNTVICGFIEAMCPSSPLMLSMSPEHRVVVRTHLGMRPSPQNILQWLMPNERAVFRRHLGYAVDLFMNGLSRGVVFPLEAEDIKEADPITPPEEQDVAVLEQVLAQAFMGLHG